MKFVLITLCASALALFPAVVNAQTNEELKTQIEELKEQVKDLEEKVRNNEKEKNDVTDTKELEKCVEKVEKKTAGDKIHCGAVHRTSLRYSWRIVR